MTIKNKMESFINCPECGELLPVTLTPCQSKETDKFLREFEEMLGVGKSEHFEGEKKCKCGKIVVATLHITAGP